MSEFTRIRRAALAPVEIYTPERKAEFLLANAVDAADRKKAEAAARKLGVTVSRPRLRRRAGR